MKITLLFLLLLNGLFFGWSQWVAKTPQDLAVATPEPEAEPLVLFREQFPERARAEREAVEKIARDLRLAEQAKRAAQKEAEQAADAAQAKSDATVDTGQTVATVAGTDAAPPADPIGDPAEASAQNQGESSLTSNSNPADTDTTASAPVDREAALAALNNLAQEQPPAAAPLQAMTLDGPATDRCVQLGPFVNLRDAVQAAAALSKSGLDPAQRLEQAKVWVGHWVHLPPAESREAAVATVEQLRNDGVSDIYIESTGELRHSISLGLFSDAEGAEIRAGKIRKLGVKPQIRDRYRDGSVYWVDFDLAPGQNVYPAGFGGSPGREIILKERDCNQLTSG